MFPPLKTDMEARFASINAFYRATGSLRGDAAATAKGMMLVQIYAAYEFTVKSVVSVAIDVLNAHNHKMKDISPSLITLFLDPEFRSLRDGGGRNVWDNRLRIVNRAFSNDRAYVASNTRTPHDGSHYRYQQLLIIFRVFGINRAPVRRRAHILRINEVVRHRNSIAHGDELPEAIGGRYTRAEIRRVGRQMKSVFDSLISIFEEFCADNSRHLRR